MPVDPRILSDLSIAEVDNLIGSDSFITISNRGPNVVQSIERYQAEQAQISNLQFPHDRPKYYFQIDLAHYSRNNVMDVRTGLNTVGTIILPMPNQLVDAQSVKYGTENLGVLTGTLLNAAIGAAGGATNIQQSSQPLTDVGSALSSPQGAAAAATGAATGAAVAVGGAIADKIDPGIQNAAKAFFGFSPNQFLTVLLEGPTYKIMNFSWHLIPRTFAESETLRKIVMDLHNASAPGLALGGAVFSFPMISQCKLMPNYNYLFRFKPTVITDVNVDYAPVGSPAFYHRPQDGEYNPPESIRLSLQMMELEYWLKSDYMDRNVGPYSTTGPARKDESFVTLNAIEGVLTGIGNAVANAVTNARRSRGVTE